MAESVSESMVRNHIERISHLETIQDVQTAIVEAQGNTIGALAKSIDGLSQQFTQVKWAVLGAAGLYVATQIGAVELLKRIIS